MDELISELRYFMWSIIGKERWHIVCYIAVDLSVKRVTPMESYLQRVKNKIKAEQS
jgi:hypothetical protein